MRDVVERERDRGERLAASRGDGERKSATVGSGFCFARSKNFCTNIHDSIRRILCARSGNSLVDGGLQHFQQRFRRAICRQTFRPKPPGFSFEDVGL